MGILRMRKLKITVLVIWTLHLLRASSKTKSRLSQLLNRGRPPKIQKDRETTERYKAPIKLVRPVFKEKPVTERIESNLDKDQKQAITFAQKQRLSQLFNRSRPPKLSRLGGAIKNISQSDSPPNQNSAKLETLETEKEFTNEEKEPKAEKEVFVEDDNHDKELDKEPKIEIQEEINNEPELKLELLIKEEDDQSENKPPTTNSQELNEEKTNKSDQTRTKTSVTFSTSEVTRVERVSLTPQELENFIRNSRKPKSSGSEDEDPPSR